MSKRPRAAARGAARLLALVLVASLAATGCTTVEGTGTSSGEPSRSWSEQPDADAPAEPAVRLSVTRHRTSQRVIAASRTPATDRGATLMREGGRSHLWWCGHARGAKPAEAAILHGSAGGLDGRFTPARGAKRRAVLPGGTRGFDGRHTCDPSVIKVGGVYYLYYTGTRGKPGTGNAIGLATSKNGLRWRRANDGKPIVRPTRPARRGYGAGRPAAVHLDGWFYLLFTDTSTGGGGQFLLRSRDPAFRDRVQALGDEGFRPVGGTGAARTRSLATVAGADLMWVDVLDAFAVVHRGATGTTLTFWDRGFSGYPYPRVRVPGSSGTDVGLARTPAGHAPRSERDPCGTVPIDLVRATRGGQKRAGLRHVGADLAGARACTTRADALRLLDGYAFPSPEHTMDLITGGELIRVERRSVATLLARNGVLARRPPLAGIDVTARLNSGTPVLRSRDGESGLLLDDGRLWPLRDPALAQRIARRNESDLRTVGDIAWGAYPVASVLG